MTFKTLDTLLDTDWIELTLPKWNQDALFPSPMITYDPDALQCSGILNTKEQFQCFLERGTNTDTIKLFRPLQKTVADSTTDETSESVNTDDVVVADNGKIAVGSDIIFLVGPILNPISTAPMTGFTLRTLSSNLGNIASGFGSLEVTTEAVISSSEDTVSLSVTETLINENSNFLIEVDLPVPLNKGCQIDLFIPKPLSIGPDLATVTIGGLFGSLREA